MTVCNGQECKHYDREEIDLDVYTRILKCKDCGELLDKTKCKDEGWYCSDCDCMHPKGWKWCA